MATNHKQSGLKETLQLNPKVDLKKSELNIETTEKAVKKIHSTNAKTKRITLDVPLETYTGMKMKVFNAGITLREYVLDLINDDLK